ncbi:DUF808 domain-containing protein [Bowmanella sp. JS7-9]|uniref:DUF808 domain-containing protein n=1 Tax=Pseudobowmanella zhangzhouensis TaxID=1537679 RepID=A0ABW1XQ51_9ALTE|nr:DUF808 domain-containing protein [Bowmanella sp. JS7-9]TBX22065.1 membrane protein [Bowmanella sp. JS7-9]
MPGASLLTLLDDIATVLDDVALMSKTAAKQTAGVLGDDLALNAEQVSGVRAERELPVVWAVTKGSLLNKVILVPIALLLSYFLPQAITPLLVIGGLYLCYEGVEKVWHSLHKPDQAAHQAELDAIADPNVDLVAFEKAKINGAIRTDFILSAEIIVIALGTVTGASLLTQSITLALVALGLTLCVYGLVALIVKLDDMGLALVKRHGGDGNQFLRRLGHGLLSFAPRLMKFLSVAGTAAMFLVGGGILVHAFAFLHHFSPDIAGLTGTVINALYAAVCGAIAGSLLLATSGLYRLVKNR